MATDSKYRQISTPVGVIGALLMLLQPLRLGAQEETAPLALPELVITGAAPFRVEHDIAVASIRFETEHPRLEIGDGSVELHGDLHGKADGGGYHIAFEGSNGSLRFVSAATVTGTIEGSGTPAIEIDGASLVFNGAWQGDATSASSSIALCGDSSFYVGPDALLNTQHADGIHSSGFTVKGSGMNSIFELDPGFEADRGNFPSMEQWQPTGFSKLTIHNASLVTHATQSLPAIHKRTASGHHSHHGAISFATGTNNQWIVRGAAQTYDGAVLVGPRLTIETEKDLILTGRYIPESGAYFGSYDSVPTEIIKRGVGRLAVMGTQAFAPSSHIFAAQGTILWHTDPTYLARSITVREGGSIRCGSPLLTIENGATVRLAHAPTYHFDHIASDGNLHIDTPSLAVRTGIDLAPFSSIVIPARHLDKQRPLVTSGAAIVLNGRLVIEGSLAPGSYRIFAAPAISGVIVVETEHKQPAELVGGNLIVPPAQRSEDHAVLSAVGPAKAEGPAKAAHSLPPSPQ